MDWNQEIIRLLNTNSLLRTMRIFNGSNLSQDSHSKEGVIGKLTSFGSTINKITQAPDQPKVKGPKLLQRKKNLG